MSINETPTMPGIIRDLQRKVTALEAAVRKPASYTTSGRPDPTTNEGGLIYNVTTHKHQGSNGTSWVDLY